MDIDVILLIFFLILSFFCSGSETALFSLSSISMEDLRIKYPKRGELINLLLEDPQKLLITILITNTFANIMATLSATTLFSKYFPQLNLWIIIILITIMLLIFGEATPKTLAINFSSQISLIIAPVFYFLSKLFFPFIFILKRISNALVELNSFLFFHGLKEEKHYHNDEMIEVIKESKTKGILSEVEGYILQNILEFPHNDIKQIMKPRSDIFSFSINLTIEEIYEQIKIKKFTRIPIWENNDDNIIGILNVKDIISVDSVKRKLSYYRNILRKPHFVPESLSSENLLRFFQTKGCHLAIVIDEFGGITGLVSLEDVLEEIIGEVVDKDDVVPLYRIINDEMIEVEAKMELDEINYLLGTDYKSKESATIAGFIYEQIKRIPATGDSFTFEQYKMRILEAQPHKIDKILITRLPDVTKKNRKKRSKK